LPARARAGPGARSACLSRLSAGPPAGLLDERYLGAISDTRDDIQVGARPLAAPPCSRQRGPKELCASAAVSHCVLRAAQATVLSVHDEEVGVERYVSPEERARQEAARRAEEEAAKRSARDNVGERALRQMMGGTLAPRGGGPDGEGSGAFSLPPPAWLTALGVSPDAVNPKLITEDQARELKDWQAREKALQEERAKRVGVLESELRTAKAAIEDVVGRFDEALQGLAGRRHKAAAEVAALEARILGLARGLARCARSSEAVEKGLLARLGSAKEAHSRAAAELAERRGALSELEAKQAQLAADERLMDRNFKKEFSDSDIHFRCGRGRAP
jgi:hypothetical protein